MTKVAPGLGTVKHKFDRRGTVLPAVRENGPDHVGAHVRAHVLHEAKQRLRCVRAAHVRPSREVELNGLLGFLALLWASMSVTTLLLLLTSLLALQL